MTLRLSGVEAGYGETIVLRDVTVTVPDGSVVALLGANGAGKTTLLRAASGMLPVSRGSISIDGEDLTGRPVEAFVRHGVAHIPEGRSIFPRMTVRENLAGGGAGCGRTGDGGVPTTRGAPQPGRRHAQRR